MLSGSFLSARLLLKNCFWTLKPGVEVKDMLNKLFVQKKERFWLYYIKNCFWTLKPGVEVKDMPNKLFVQKKILAILYE